VPDQTTAGQAAGATMTLHNAALFLGADPEALCNAVKAGRLPCVRVPCKQNPRTAGLYRSFGGAGRRTAMTFRRADLEAFLAAPAPRCACGCGAEVPRLCWNGREGRYLHGHNLRRPA
jgi:hypothetical protein